MLNVLKKVRISWPLFAIGIFYTYLGYHTLSGNQGLLKWGVYKDKITAYEVEIERLRVKRHGLEMRAAQLRAHQLDLDFLDEETRRVLNVSYPNEIVIWLDGSP